MKCGIFLLSMVAGGLWAQGPASKVPLPASVENTVALALSTNVALSLEQTELALAQARLEEIKASLQPRVDLLARYTRSDGGRTIDLPLGDLLNGAYTTLNDYLVSQGRPAAFPSIGNQSISLLRREEQETKLRLTQVLWRPELTRLTRASRLSAEARAAQVVAFRRELRQVVASAYLVAEQAERGHRILEEALALTAEALRVNQVLLREGKITEDQVLRAEAEDLRLREQVQEALRDANAARRQVNFLLNRDLETPLASPPEAELVSCIEISTTLWSQRPGLGQREELAALDLAVKAAEAQESASKARYQPTLALAVEGGLQGESYRTDEPARFVQGSLVAEVNLWDGRGRRSQVAQARIARRQLELQREQVTRSLEFQVARAWDEWQAAKAGYATARRRAEAAEKSFQFVTRREREGVVNQLVFLDARNEHTAAALQASLARYRVLIAALTLEQAVGTPSLP